MANICDRDYKECVMAGKYKWILTCFGSVLAVFLLSITLSLKAMDTAANSLEKTVSLIEMVERQKARLDVVDVHIVNTSRNLEELKISIKEMRIEIKEEMRSK